MSEWLPPSAQDYPASESDGLKKLIGTVQDVAQKTRDATKNLLRTAGVRALPGRIASLDFDGTSHGSLGTRGWSLGSDSDGQPSYLALNGLDVYETLQAQIDAVEAAQEALATQQVALQTQVNRIDALINQQVTVSMAGTATVSGWSSGTGQETKASGTIPVPAGYSRGYIFALASMHFMDSSPNGGWVRAVIAGQPGAEMGGLANLQLGQSASHTREITGLNGGTLTLECQMRSSVATGGMSGRIAQVSGFGIFLR